MKPIEQFPERFRLTHEQTQRRGLHPGIGSDATYGRNGMFLVPCGSQILRCMVSDGLLTEAVAERPDVAEWEHVSVSLSHRCPTWEEMCFVKDMFFQRDEACVQFHPAERDYVNNHPFCLHVWRPRTLAIPLPPAICVGVKSLGIIGK